MEKDSSSSTNGSTYLIYSFGMYFSKYFISFRLPPGYLIIGFNLTPPSKYISLFYYNIISEIKK